MDNNLNNTDENKSLGKYKTKYDLTLQNSSICNMQHKTRTKFITLYQFM